jgi:hypothetical protein
MLRVAEAVIESEAAREEMSAEILLYLESC